MELKVSEVTDTDVMKILGMGYALSMESSYYSKRNLGSIWKAAYKRNGRFFRSYGEIFEVLKGSTVKIQTTFECGMPGCVPNQWVHLQQVRPSRHSR